MTAALFARRPTEQEREVLEEWLMSGDAERARRARVILDSAAGKTAMQIGLETGFHPDNLKKWIRKFNSSGLAGIEVLKRGPKSKFTAEQIEALRELYSKPPESLGFSFKSWTPQKLATAAVKLGIVPEISHVTMRQIITRDGEFSGTASEPEIGVREAPDPSLIGKLIVCGQRALANGENELAVESLRKILLQQSGLSAEQEAEVRDLLSEGLENLSQYEEMLATMQKYEDPSVRSSLPPQLQARVRLRLGWAYARNGNYAKAIARFNDARLLFMELESSEGLATSYYALGYAYIDINEFELARSFLLKALDFLDYSKDLRLLARVYINLGLISFVEGDFEGAKSSYLKAEEYTKGINDPILRGLISMNLGSVYVNYGKQAEASLYFERAVREFLRSGQRSNLALAYNNLGNNLMKCGRWIEALQSLDKALELAEALGDKRNSGLTLITLGELKFHQGDFHVAEESLLQALSFLEDTDRWAEVDAKRTLGRLYSTTGQFDKSLKTLREALQLATRIGNLYEVCLCHLALAEFYYSQQGYEQAEVYLELAKENLKGKHDPDLHANGWAQRLAGRLALARQSYDEARQHISASINIFASINDKYELASSHAEMGKLCMMLGEFQSAREHLENARKSFLTLGAKADVAKVDEILHSQQKIPQVQVELRHNDVLLMQRLIEAATSREILLKELATIIYESFSSAAVVVFESVDSTLPRPVVTLGKDDAQAEALAKEMSSLTSVAVNTLGSASVFTLEDHVRSRFWVYIEPKNGRIDPLRLKPLFKQSELALENCALRSMSRSAVLTQDFTRLRPQVLLPGFIYASKPMCDVVERIKRIRTSDTTVLITGESGTGKDVIARAIHAESSRRDAIFLPFNCTATPKDLIESQLFGHRKGAFTGATSNYQGVIRAAEGGTLFLDEIGDLSLEVQPKLLRFLEAGEIQPLGEARPIKVDVRVLAATNADLERAVEQGRFREDLLYRLNIIRIHVPPLRERREEIPLLINHYLQHFSTRSGKKNITLSQEAMDYLVNYNWPGNVRQLRTEIERLMAYAVEDSVILAEDLSPEIVRTRTEHKVLPSSSVAQTQTNNSADSRSLKEATFQLEKRIIADALERNDFNISKTARELGLSRHGLRLKMVQFGLIER
ncbi:MAG: sigma 54-interacting transcriptional regulator [Acidobacteriota bacterium]|nr:sigma 54-interacting transcriptional regulator [Blastocatellia bacterium]MDW8413729.1 sigma 54-interacting transcriptional regulator [Acidobacteriota bacterium]